MIRGIFTAATSMMARQTQQEIISNNLANTSTAGYKKDRMSFRNTLDASLLTNTDPQKGPAEEVQTDFRQGRLYETGSPYDFALEDDGFFVIAGTDGNFYTRNGHFMVNDQGELLTTHDQPVLGADGPVILPPGEFAVNQKGEIVANNQVIGTILVAKFPEPYPLEKAGDNLFRQLPNTPQPDFVEPRLRQGFLEDSNVNTIEEMVDMILVMRNFNDDQKSIQTQDETLRRAVSDLGRV